MLTQHIALVPEADGVHASELARVSAALQKQVMRDLAPQWGVSATVDAFPRLEDVPVGYWPIIVTFCELGRDAGVHLDRHGQPYAQIEVSPSWSLAASRACLEMLVNPFGQLTTTATSPRGDQGPVEWLVEVCAPCADARYAYAVNEVLVSDFCTPAFFRPGPADSHARYSWTGAITAPFQTLPGGHVTWYDPVSDSWWMQQHGGDRTSDAKLGGLEGRVASARALVRERAPLALPSNTMSVEASEARVGVIRQHASQASQFRAHRLRAQLGHRLGSDYPPNAMPSVSRQDLQVWSLPVATRRQSAPETRTSDASFERLVQLFDESQELSIEVEPERAPQRASQSAPQRAPQSVPPSAPQSAPPSAPQSAPPSAPQSAKAAEVAPSVPPPLPNASAPATDAPAVAPVSTPAPAPVVAAPAAVATATALPAQPSVQPTAAAPQLRVAPAPRSQSAPSAKHSGMRDGTLLVVGALGAAALFALVLIGRSTAPAANPSQLSATPVNVGVAPQVPAAAPTAQLTTSVSAATDPALAGHASPAAREPAPAPTPAAVLVSETAPSPELVAAAARRRHHARGDASPPAAAEGKSPSASNASPPVPVKRASDALDELINTRQ